MWWRKYQLIGNKAVVTPQSLSDTPKTSWILQIIWSRVPELAITLSTSRTLIKCILLQDSYRPSGIIYKLYIHNPSVILIAITVFRPNIIFIFQFLYEKKWANPLYLKLIRDSTRHMNGTYVKRVDITQFKKEITLSNKPPLWTISVRSK